MRVMGTEYTVIFERLQGTAHGGIKLIGVKGEGRRQKGERRENQVGHYLA